MQRSDSAALFKDNVSFSSHHLQSSSDAEVICEFKGQSGSWSVSPLEAYRAQLKGENPAEELDLDDALALCTRDCKKESTPVRDRSPSSDSGLCIDLGSTGSPGSSVPNRRVSEPESTVELSSEPQSVQQDEGSEEDNEIEIVGISTREPEVRVVSAPLLKQIIPGSGELSDAQLNAIEQHAYVLFISFSQSLAADQASAPVISGVATQLLKEPTRSRMDRLKNLQLMLINNTQLFIRFWQVGRFLVLYADHACEHVSLLSRQQVPLTGDILTQGRMMANYQAALQTQAQKSQLLDNYIRPFTAICSGDKLAALFRTNNCFAELGTGKWLQGSGGGFVEGVTTRNAANCFPMEPISAQNMAVNQ
ncbi:hypothetical protein [Parendozoicomonas haliclonae]|uniref:Uncharacterized protein n=1 Tax=Parendozoicomonas haliclonae TaxID=1960125 RepID=A0A1X7AMQ9_9GAMM|nr:hypothetical protein [Parendozoicomonas haliclonae]SMA49588.1 hypothetical protein EHSB41UT_03373 [Parendozoicomonas haliclonae]